MNRREFYNKLAADQQTVSKHERIIDRVAACGYFMGETSFVLTNVAQRVRQPWFRLSAAGPCKLWVIKHKGW